VLKSVDFTVKFKEITFQNFQKFSVINSQKFFYKFLLKFY